MKASTLSEEDEYWITLTDVKDFFFCLQESFFKHIMGVSEPSTISMELSNYVHSSFDLRRLPRFLKPATILRNL
ncbi:MAG: hypothetical protein QXF74_02885 [Nitrososphaerota archaeon]